MRHFNDKTLLGDLDGERVVVGVLVAFLLAAPGWVALALLVVL